MKELNRTDRLTIASILFAIILVIGLITVKKPQTPFSRTIDETLKLITSSKDIIAPAEFKNMISQNTGSFLLIDVRSPLDYHKSHINEAVSMPIQEILNPENLKTIKKLDDESGVAVLYGNDQLEANSAWMILKQIGYDNLKVLEGGYFCYSALETKTAPADSQDCQAEKPVINYQEEMNKQGIPQSTAGIKTIEPIKVIKKEKKSATEGGC
jgi:rhodanese-related sulfurtransferase